MADGFIEIHGIKELNRELRQFEDKYVQKAVGRAHKRVGRGVIDRWLRPSPTDQAVGKGAGASVRPSASKREVLLRVGGKHRESGRQIGRDGARLPNARPWGKRDARQRTSDGRFRNAPDRPDIRGSVDRNADEIAGFYLDELAAEVAHLGLEKRR